MVAREFDPLATPYAVDNEEFPWESTWKEKMTHLLRYAVLAPSSHNTQPWKFQIFDRGIAVFADYTRRLPVTDPNSRELLMGVGAAIMNLRIAAVHFGFVCRVDYNSTDDSELPCAFVSLSHQVSRKFTEEPLGKLLHSIPRRHTNRHKFLAARVPDSVVVRLAALAQDRDVGFYVSTDAKRNMQVARLVAEAERSLQAETEFRKELAEWLRPNFTQKTDGMTGAAFGISDLGSTIVPWAVKALDMGELRARHDERLCMEAPALCVLYGDDSTLTWLAVGEVLQKIFLTITNDGLQLSFFNMPIEIPDARLALRQILGIKSLPQLLLRIGYSLEKAAPTPRRPVEDCIVPGSP